MRIQISQTRVLTYELVMSTYELAVCGNEDYSFGIVCSFFYNVNGDIWGVLSFSLYASVGSSILPDEQPRSHKKGKEILKK